jgi:hypothetical protein
MPNKVRHGLRLFKRNKDDPNPLHKGNGFLEIGGFSYVANRFLASETME